MAGAWSPVTQLAQLMSIMIKVFQAFDWTKISVGLPTHPPIPMPRYLTCASFSAQINQNVAEICLLSPAFTTSFEWEKVNHGPLDIEIPLRYCRPVMSILTVLNRASGYCLLLHRATGRVCDINVFVIALYLSSTVGADCTSAREMVALDHQKVVGLMGVLQHIHVEAPHDPIPGIAVGELGGPIFGLVQVIAKILNETDRALQSGGVRTLGVSLRGFEKAKEAWILPPTR